jgi:hypothetical protein
LYQQTVTNLEVLSNLTNETLERELADEEFRRLLVPTNLAQRDGTGTEPVWLLHTTSGCLMTQSQTSARDHDGNDDKGVESDTYSGGSLTSSLGCELLTGSLT